MKSLDTVTAGAKAAGKDAKDESAERARGVAAQVRAFATLASGVATQSTKVAVQVGHAGLDYAQKSLRNMGVAVEAEPTAAAA